MRYLYEKNSLSYSCSRLVDRFYRSRLLPLPQFACLPLLNERKINLKQTRMLRVCFIYTFLLELFTCNATKGLV